MVRLQIAESNYDHPISKLFSLSLFFVFNRLLITAENIPPAAPRVSFSSQYELHPRSYLSCAQFRQGNIVLYNVRFDNRTPHRWFFCHFLGYRSSVRIKIDVFWPFLTKLYIFFVELHCHTHFYCLSNTYIYLYIYLYYLSVLF